MRDDFKKLVKEKRLIEAAELFSLIIGTKTFDQLDEELELVDIFLQKLLPSLISNNSTWLIKNPSYTTKFLALTINAFERDYLPSEMIYLAMHLRCFLAIADALKRNVQGVHKEVLYAADSKIAEQKIIDEKPPSHLDEFLKKNGITPSLLEIFFAAYFDYLKEIGRENIVERVGWIIKKCILELEKEETRPGVVRGLFIKEERRAGVLKNILVRIEEGAETIEYSHLEREKLGETLKDAADVARKVAHNFLVEKGYSEGLSNRKVIWQIVRTNGKVEDVSVFYDGASICLPLSTAIISYYLNQPVASDIAFTGTFNIHSIEEGRVLGVAGIQAKTEIALESGIKKIFIPRINRKELDLSTEKKAEDLKVEIISVNKLHDIYTDLFYKPKPIKFKSIVQEIWDGISLFLHVKKSKIEIRPDYLKYENHIWLSSGLYTLLYILDGFANHFTYQKSTFLSATLIIAGGAAIIFLGLIICFILPPLILEREKRNSWFIGLGITFVSTIVVYLLYLPIVPFYAVDLSKAYDWPPILGMLKNFIIFWIFAAIFLTNIYNYVVSLNLLIKRHQFITVRNCLEGKEESEAMLPTAVLRFGWKDGVLAIALAGVFLIVFEMYYYTNLYEHVKQTNIIIMFGIIRNIVFIVLAAEVLIWYKNVLSSIRKKAGR